MNTMSNRKNAFLPIHSDNFNTVKFTDSEESRLLEYLNNFDYLFAVRGYLDDPVKGEKTRIEEAYFDDGKFKWSSLDIYCFEHYGLAMSKDFQNHLINQAIINEYLEP